MPSGLPLERKPYAYYVRVPDILDFLRHVAPVLEDRLARSIAVGHSGELRLTFYRSGVRLVFERGRLVEVEPWTPQSGWVGHAGFPDYTFLQVLFGYRSLDELKAAFPDCWLGDDATAVLLNALFPKAPSNVWALG
jgi:hypothetical protein